MNTHSHHLRSKRHSEAPGQPPRLGAIIIGIVLVMAITVPLLCGSSFLTNVGKVLTFEVLGAMLISCMLLTIRIDGIMQRLKENIKAGPNLLVLSVALCAVVSFLFSPINKWLTVHELARVIVCTAIYFGVAYNLKSRLTLMTDVLLAVSAAVAAFGLASVGDRDISQAYGITGSFGTHEALGSYLMLMLPVTASLAIFNRQDEKRRIIAIAVSLLVVVCLAFSQSRSGWISELVALAVLAGLGARFYSVKTTAPKQKFISALPFVAFAAITGLMIAVSGSGGDVQNRLGTLGAASTDMSLHVRVELWHAALVMLAAKPVLGWGLGSFPYIASHFTAVALPSSFVASNGANLSNIAHNYYLQTAAETGLLGLGLYVGMLATFFVVGIRAMGSLKDGSRKIVLAGVLAAVAGQVVDAVTSPSYNIASISLFQWMLMGIGMFAAGVPVQEDEPVEEPARITGSIQAKVRRGAAGAAAAMVCLSSVAVFVGSAGTAVADSYTRHGISDTDAWLIGIGAGGAGYWIGSTFVHFHHHHPDGGPNNGQGNGNGHGNGNGQDNGGKPTSYEGDGRINDRVNSQVSGQLNYRADTQ